MDRIKSLSLGFICLAAVGCGDKKPTCENAVEHTIEIMPANLKDRLGDKQTLIEKCEKETTAEERKCVLAAKDMAGLMQCAKSKKE
jgi:hypothetical protein